MATKKKGDSQNSQSNSQEEMEKQFISRASMFALDPMIYQDKKAQANFEKYNREREKEESEKSKKAAPSNAPKTCVYRVLNDPTVLPDLSDEYFISQSRAAHASRIRQRGYLLGGGPPGAKVFDPIKHDTPFKADEQDPRVKRLEPDCFYAHPGDYVSWRGGISVLSSIKVHPDGRREAFMYPVLLFQKENKGEHLKTINVKPLNSKMISISARALLSMEKMSAREKWMRQMRGRRTFSKGDVLLRIDDANKDSHRRTPIVVDCSDLGFLLDYRFRQSSVEYVKISEDFPPPGELVFHLHTDSTLFILNEDKHDFMTKQNHIESRANHRDAVERKTQTSQRPHQEGFTFKAPSIPSNSQKFTTINPVVLTAPQSAATSKRQPRKKKNPPKASSKKSSSRLPHSLLYEEWDYASQYQSFSSPSYPPSSPYVYQEYSYPPTLDGEEGDSFVEEARERFPSEEEEAEDSVHHHSLQGDSQGSDECDYTANGGEGFL